MKRIGLVGVGKWSEQLREALRLEGCHVVAHARKSDVPHPCSGPLVTIEEMVRMDDVDFVLAVADPETTTRAVELCAEWCKPVVATKPLLRHPRTVAASIVVDMWRLFSIPWLRFKDVVTSHSTDKWSPGTLDIEFVGKGPMREFSGLLDYGPHALAMALDLSHSWSKEAIVSGNELDGVTCFVGPALENRGVEVTVRFGNGGERRACKARYERFGQIHTFEDSESVLTYTAPNGEKLRQEKGSALRTFAREALGTITSGTLCRTYKFSTSAQISLDWILAEQARQRDELAGQSVPNSSGNLVPNQG